MRLETFITATCDTLMERREKLVLSQKYHNEMIILIEPSAEELVGLINQTSDKELRGVMMIDPDRNQVRTIVWDAAIADHNTTKAALRAQGWRPLQTGTPELEFALNPGFGTRNVAHSGMIQYGPVWGTNNRRFKDSWLAQRLVRMPKMAMTEAESSYDPRARYDEFNRLYFGGELPDIPVGFKKFKGAGGIANVTVRRDPTIHPALQRIDPNRGLTPVPGTMSITINNIVPRPAQSYDGILLHEMVHIWMFMQGEFKDREGGHPWKFQKKCRELESQYGIKVSLTDNYADGDASDLPLRTMNVALAYMNGRPSSWALIADKALGLFPTDRFSKSFRVVLAKVTGPEWTKIGLKAPIQRPTKIFNLKFYRLTDDSKAAAVEEFERTGQVIFDSSQTRME